MTGTGGNHHVLTKALVLVLVSLAAVDSEFFFERRDRRDESQYDSHKVAKVVSTEYQGEAYLKRYGYLNCRSRRRRRDTSEELSLLGHIMEEGQALSRDGKDPEKLDECTQEDITKALKRYQRMYGIPETGVFDKATREGMNYRRCGNKDNGEDLTPATTPSPTPTSTPHRRRRRRRSTQYIKEGDVQSSHELNGQTGRETTLSKRKHRLRTLREIMGRTKSRRKRSTPFNGNQTNAMFSKKEVTYRILESGYSTKISIADQWKLLDLAFRMWSEVIPITFKAKPHGNVLSLDVEVAFGRGSHQNCFHDFDGEGGEIAHAWLTGDMHLDDDEPYKSDGELGINFLTVAVHEIGHILGLNHSDRRKSIMNGIYHKTQDQFELDWRDRKEVQKIYGVCKGKFDVVMDWVRRGPTGNRVYNTYFFREHKYWLYENRFNRTRYGDPQMVMSMWGVPPNIDGYLHILYYVRASHTIISEQYFFQGCNVYKFHPDENKVMAGWPRPMQHVFPGVPCNIDSVVFDSRDRLIYFFKRDHVFIHNHMASHCCVRTSTLQQEFPDDRRSTKPLPSDLDSVYYSYKDDAQYFIKDDDVWENVAYGRGRRPGHNSIRYIGSRAEKWYDICDIDA